jgi:signal transduction histidine kinase
VVEQMRAQTGRHQLTLRAPDRMDAQVDPFRLEQVVLNLLDNAIKFSPEGGEIEVDLERIPEGCVRLSVRDHGIGVPPKHRRRLFERFYQAHGKEHRSGMGLGLFICSEIVRRHGGSIRAEAPEGGGTRFVVELPAEAPNWRVPDAQA